MVAAAIINTFPDVEMSDPETPPTPERPIPFENREYVYTPLPINEINNNKCINELIKLKRNVQRLLRMCGRDRADSEIADHIIALKENLQRFKNEFDTLPELKDTCEHQKQTLQALLESIQTKDEFFAKLTGQPIEKPKRIQLSIKDSTKDGKKITDKNTTMMDGNLFKRSRFRRKNGLYQKGLRRNFNEKLPIERRRIDPSKIRKLKQKIAEDNQKTAMLTKAVSLIDPKQLPKPRDVPMSKEVAKAANSKDAQKSKETSMSRKESTASVSAPLVSASAHEEPMEKAFDPQQSFFESESLLRFKEKSNSEVKIMPLPGKKLRKPNIEKKTAVAFNFGKFKSNNGRQMETIVGLKTAFGIEGSKKSSNVNEKNVSDETEKPLTWRELKKILQEGKSDQANKNEAPKTIGSSAASTSKSSKDELENQKQKKALRKLLKIKSHQAKQAEEARKKKKEEENARQQTSTEKMNIFKFYENEKAKKQAEKEAAAKQPKLRIVKKLVKKPITPGEAILRKVRRNAIANANKQGGYHTSPLLTIKYICELQALIRNSQNSNIPLTSKDFQQLRFKYFPSKNQEATKKFENKKKMDSKKSEKLSKTDMDLLHKTALLKVSDSSKFERHDSFIVKPKDVMSVMDLSTRIPRKEYNPVEVDEEIYTIMREMDL